MIGLYLLAPPARSSSPGSLVFNPRSSHSLFPNSSPFALPAEILLRILPTTDLMKGNAVNNTFFLLHHAGT